MVDTEQFLRHLLRKCHLPEGELAVGQEKLAWAIAQGRRYIFYFNIKKQDGTSTVLDFYSYN